MYCGAYSYLSDLIRVLQNLYLSYRTYTGLTELILVFRSTYWYFGSYTCITELIHVFQISYMYYRTYTCLTKLILVLRNLYWYFGAHTGISDLIRVLQNLYLCYGSYSCAKVPVGTMSRNRSGSYHIEGQIGLLQIRRLFVRRYKSQIHYTEITVVMNGLIITLQNLYLFYRYKSTRRYYQTYTYLTDTGVPLGTTGLILVLPIREYP